MRAVSTPLVALAASVSWSTSSTGPAISTESAAPTLLRSLSLLGVACDRRQEVVVTAETPRWPYEARCGDSPSAPPFEWLRSHTSLRSPQPALCLCTALVYGGAARWPQCGELGAIGGKTEVRARVWRRGLPSTGDDRGTRPIGHDAGWDATPGQAWRWDGGTLGRHGAWRCGGVAVWRGRRGADGRRFVHNLGDRRGVFHRTARRRRSRRCGLLPFVGCMSPTSR